MTKTSRLILLVAVLLTAAITVWLAGGWAWHWVLRMHGVH